MLLFYVVYQLQRSATGLMVPNLLLYNPVRPVAVTCANGNECRPEEIVAVDPA